MAEIALEHVSYIYGAKTPFEIKALDDVSLTVRSGSITGIIGHTGSGKSTLVQLFNGLEKPQAGRVLLDGRDIWEKPKEMRNIRFRVGLVMQYPEYQLFEETIRADIAFGPRNMGLSEQEILHKMGEAVQNIMDKERTLRGKPTGEAALRRADRIHRAEGIARYATMLSSEEFFSLFADLKLGVALGEITSLSHEALHAMLIHALPATLSIQAADTPKNGTERDLARAAFLKQCWEVQK